VPQTWNTELNLLIYLNKILHENFRILVVLTEQIKPVQIGRQLNKYS